MRGNSEGQFGEALRRGNPSHGHPEIPCVSDVSKKEGVASAWRLHTGRNRRAEHEKHAYTKQTPFLHRYPEQPALVVRILIWSADV
jgi:hypothetical protein